MNTSICPTCGVTIRFAGTEAYIRNCLCSDKLWPDTPETYKDEIKKLEGNAKYIKACIQKWKAKYESFNAV